MKVEHQIDQQRFVSILDGHEAEMTYQYVNEGTVDFNHTYVPDAFRGHGVAAELVKAGAGWADEQGLSVQASCSYARIKLARMKR